MTSLIYKNPINAIKRLSGSDIDIWKDYYNFFNLATDIVDRTGLLELPVRTSTHNLCKLPKLRQHNLSYDECCNTRANEIWKLSKQLDLPIGIMWSGGIDSTRVLVSFLSNFPLSELKDRVTIICSENSIIENPVFYRKFVLPNFNLINSESVPWLFDKKLLLVTGELNDELFGSHRAKNYLMSNPDRYTAKFDQARIFNYVHKSITNADACKFLVDVITQTSIDYGITLETDMEWFWWTNFCYTWQHNYMRFFTLVAPHLRHNITDEFLKNYVHHFYSTDDFQLWSVNAASTRSFNNWQDYKREAKLGIFKFDSNEEYLTTKTKRGSLATVFKHRPLIEGIDSNLVMHETIDPLLWYNSNNDLLLFK